MKRIQFGAAGVVACAMAVSLSAQTPTPSGQTPSTPSTPSASQPTQRSSDSANTVTVTGCLEKATPAPTGTSGAGAPAAASSAKFTLNNAMAATSSSPSTAGTSGASRPIASSYTLDGEDSKLTAHVGHKVEITGTVEDRSASPSSSPSAASSSSAAGPKLKVSNVKMIASSCTP